MADLNAEMLRGFVLPAGDIQVREHQNGTWSVWYQDEAWIPCPPVCKIKEIDRKHKCDMVRPYVQSYFGVRGISAEEPDHSFEAAMEYAEYLQAGNEEREIKVMELKR